MARFLALSASLFTDPLLWDKTEYCRFRAAVDLCGLASFAKRDFEEHGVALQLEVRETRPLSVRFLMDRWGWKSTATVARFLSSLETRSGTLTKHRTTRLGNTYLVGVRLLALCGETPNETPNETGFGTANETKDKKEKNKFIRNSPLRGESREGGSENGTAPRKRAAPKPLPDEWLPNEKHRTACEAAHIDLAALVLDFRTYWRDDVNGTKTNWDLTFTKRIAAVRSTGKFRLNGKAARFVPDEASLSEIGEKIRFRTGEGDEDVPWH